MIIFSIIELEIGKIYGPETHSNLKLHTKGTKHEQFRFKVMRKSNYQEYKKYYEDLYGLTLSEPWSDYFYKISPD